MDRLLTTAVVLSTVAQLGTIASVARAGAYYYTSSIEERDRAIEQRGFQDRGEVGHVWVYLPEAGAPPRGPNAEEPTPLIRLYSAEYGNYYYVVRGPAANRRRLTGYVLDGQAGLVFPTDDCSRLQAGYQALWRYWDRVAEAYLLSTDGELDQPEDSPYERKRCLALIPAAAGPSNVVPLYQLYHPALVERCPIGKKCVRCFHRSCDQDQDGYASQPCALIQYQEYEKAADDGKGKLCEGDWLNEAEPRECDQRCDAGWVDHVRSYLLAPPWEEQAWARWNTSLSEHHPHRTEEALDGMDNDCDGRVDELEHEYLPPDLVRDSDASESIRIRARVNEAAVLGRSDVQVRFDVRRLAQYGSEDSLFVWAKDQDRSLPALAPCNSWQGEVQAGRIEADVWGGSCLDREVEVVVLEATLLDGSGHEYWSVDQFGQLTAETDVREADRLYADPLIQAACRAPMFWPPCDDRQWMHVNIINQALYEWSLSQLLGLVGTQKMPGRLWPMGTRYGADYGEKWCSEFPSYVYGQTTVNGPSGLHEVEDFWDYFGPEARRTGPLALEMLRQAQLEQGGSGEPGSYAEYGSYLGLGEDKDKGHHSAIFLSYGPWAHVVWHIGGNESRETALCWARPSLQCGTSEVYLSVHDISESYHRWVGLLNRETPKTK